MTSIEWPADGGRVCIVGRGTANPVHYHGRIFRRTKNLIIVRGMSFGRDTERRFQIDTGREFGASHYGGTHADIRCQRTR